MNMRHVNVTSVRRILKLVLFNPKTDKILGAREGNYENFIFVAGNLIKSKNPGKLILAIRYLVLALLDREFYGQTGTDDTDENNQVSP